MSFDDSSDLYMYKEGLSLLPDNMKSGLFDKLSTLSINEKTYTTFVTRVEPQKLRCAGAYQVSLYQFPYHWIVRRVFLHEFILVILFNYYKHHPVLTRRPDQQVAAR